MILYETQNRPKWVQMSKPKSPEKNVNERKWALASNSNKNFAGDVYQFKTGHMLRFLKRRNEFRK